MEKQNSNKIRLLLNELAILNQPEIHDGKFIYQLDTLQRLKQLSSELYLLTDHSLFGFANESKLPAPEFVAAPSVVPEPLAMPEEKNESLQPVSETFKMEHIPVPEVSQEPETVSIPDSPIKDVVVETPPPVVAPPPLPMVESKPPASTSKADEISAKISFSRRFEYINNLFGSDAQAFNRFLTDIVSAGSHEKSMEKFEEVYAAQNWKRKSETASDLKQLLRKLL